LFRIAVVGASTIAVVGFARTSGVTVSIAGVGFIAAGVWGRREVRTALERERIVDGSSSPVRDGGSARSLAEEIRRSTVAATHGRTYVETEPYLDVERSPTADRATALEDERSGVPVKNPDQTLWLQSTTLQTALMQAYMGARIAELTVGLGAVFVAAGFGLSAAGRNGR
jgi:hypothetical protein